MSPMLPLTQRPTSPPPGEADCADHAGESIGTNPVPFATLEREHLEALDELREAFERVVRGSAFILGEEIAGFEEARARACGTSEWDVKDGTGALDLDAAAAAIGLRTAGILAVHLDEDRGGEHGPP